MNNQTYLVSMDHPVFCLAAIVVISAFALHAVRLIMKPINDAVEHCIKNDK